MRFSQPRATGGTAGYRPLDAFSPFPVEGLAELLGASVDALRVAMFDRRTLAWPRCLFGTEWFSAVIDYPINSGGRPLNSWPAFMMLPFAVGILAAAICGLIALLVRDRAAAPASSAVRDRWISNAPARTASCSPLTPPERRRRSHDSRDCLRDAGAVAIREVPA